MLAAVSGCWESLGGWSVLPSEGVLPPEGEVSVGVMLVGDDSKTGWECYNIELQHIPSKEWPHIHCPPKWLVNKLNLARTC